MNEINQSLALAHAAKEFPREACGLLVIQKGREVYCPCRNIGVGTDQFVIHPEDFVAADRQGEIVGVFHSHPNMPPEPSQADRLLTQQLKSALALVEVRVLDHFIVGDGEPLSLAEHGWL